MVFDITSFINALAPSLGTGIFSSLIYAVWGKWANSEPFNTTKFLKTLIIGAFLGILIALTGWTPEQAADWLASLLAGVGGIYGLSKTLNIVSKVKAQVSNGSATNTSTTSTTTSTNVVPPAVVIPKNVYPVNYGDSFTNEQINAILAQGYTKWLFPTGVTPTIITPNPPCLGQTLTTDGWMGIMQSDWKPVDTHPTA